MELKIDREESKDVSAVFNVLSATLFIIAFIRDTWFVISTAADLASD